jgi:ABC-type Mn2+/Zn2+ transport system permease subunit
MDLSLLSQPYMQRAVAGVVIIAVNAAIAGSFTVFRNVSFLVAGASHSALAGAALFILLGFYGFQGFFSNPLIGAMLFAIAVAFIAGYAPKEETNTAIGISFAMSMSLAILFISMMREYAARVWSLLIGDLFLLTSEDLYLMSFVTFLTLILAMLFYRAFLFISFDWEGATAFGLNAKNYNYLLLSIIAVSAVMLLKGVGAILVFAMLVAPAAAANEVASNIRDVFIYAFIIALFSGFAGIVISFPFEVSPGAIASLLATVIYFFSFLGKRLRS